MTDYLMLVAPSANRVYAGSAQRLAAGELQMCLPTVGEVHPATIAGVEYLGWRSEPLTASDLAIVSQQSARLALFERVGDLLAPIELPDTDWLDDDLVTIPKYPGKTNEQFTRLLVNVTLAQVRAKGSAPGADAGGLDGPEPLRGLTVLDPLCGRGTTLTTAWLMGHNGYGVEGDAKAVEAMASFITGWLRRKRLKHTSGLTPVRRDGKSLGKRYDAEVRLPDDRELTLGVYTGDTRDSAALWGKKKFDAIVTDAPYGVVHGSTTDVRGHAGKRDRSAAGLLREALPVWVSQLRPGGALGLSWNTYGLTREDLSRLLTGQGLEVIETPDFSHRVDSSINRDLIIAVNG